MRCGEIKAREFDVAGVKKNGSVYGYVERPDLSDGSVGDRAKPFDVSLIVTESTGLFKLLARLRDVPQLFVLDTDHVNAIVTRADLQKAPVRLFLFGMVTLIEGHFLRTIRSTFDNDSWKSKARDYVEEAERVFVGRRSRNQAIDLASCLTFTGKVSCDEHERAMQTHRLRLERQRDGLPRANRGFAERSRSRT